MSKNKSVNVEKVDLLKLYKAERDLIHRNSEFFLLEQEFNHPHTTPDGPGYGELAEKYYKTKGALDVLTTLINRLEENLKSLGIPIPA